MKRSLFIVFFLFISLFVKGQYFRSFPYELSLTEGIKPVNIEEAGNNSANTPTGSKRYSKAGLLLTDNTDNVLSGFSLSDVTISPKYAFTVEFEYAMFDGVANKEGYGEGISFFLYDGAERFTLGAGGSALGYSYRNDPSAPNYNASKATYPGLKGGFIGIGLDVSGRFKLALKEPKNQVEGSYFDADEFHGNGANHITLRGPVNIVSGQGYPVLYTGQTSDITDGESRSKMYGASWRTYQSAPTWGFVNKLVDPFDIRTNRNEKGEVRYNKVRVECVPMNIEISIGKYIYAVNVYVTHNGIESQVIKNYFLTDTMYIPSFSNPNVLYKSNVVLPNTLRMGFAGATSDATQYQVIKNIKVSLPYAQETRDDVVELCQGLESQKGRVLDFNVFSNDSFYAGSIRYERLITVGYIALPPKKGNSAEYIDYNSFRFEDSNGNILGSSGINARYIQPNVGIWEYSSIKNTVTLSLTEDSYVDGKEYSLYYSVKGSNAKGGPFNDENYRSRPTAMVMKVKNCYFEVRLNPGFSIEASK